MESFLLSIGEVCLALSNRKPVDVVVVEVEFSRVRVDEDSTSMRRPNHNLLVDSVVWIQIGAGR